MSALQQLQDINLRVTALLKKQEQLKSQAGNWEQLYKEATDIQKKLLSQGTENAKLNESLSAEISKLKTGAGEWEQKYKALQEKHGLVASEFEKAKTQISNAQHELQAMRLKEEQQLSLHFGVEKEQEQLKAITEDLKEQLHASQRLNAELQAGLQDAKITLVEEQAQANAVSQIKTRLEKELEATKEKFQAEFSELHSRSSHIENQNEKHLIEARKLQDTIAELTQFKVEGSHTIAALHTGIEELQSKLNIEPDTELAYLRTTVAQLHAQIANIKFEQELKKKTMALPDANQASKTHEAVNQQPASNEGQVHFLYAELQASQAKNAALEQQLNTYIERLSGKHDNNAGETDELKNLQEQNKISKLAQAIEGNTVASNIELKQKLNEMIKEVDRCIAKLSS